MGRYKNLRPKRLRCVWFPPTFPNNNVSHNAALDPVSRVTISRSECIVWSPSIRKINREVFGQISTGDSGVLSMVPPWPVVSRDPRTNTATVTPSLAAAVTLGAFYATRPFSCSSSLCWPRTQTLIMPWAKAHHVGFDLSLTKCCTCVEIVWRHTEKASVAHTESRDLCWTALWSGEQRSLIVSCSSQVGNFLIVISVASTPKLRTVTNCFIVSLAVADFLVGLCVLPPAIMMYYTNGKNWCVWFCEILSASRSRAPDKRVPWISTSFSEL